LLTANATSFLFFNEKRLCLPISINDGAACEGTPAPVAQSRMGRAGIREDRVKAAG
jgi:hypothetical protein